MSVFQVRGKAALVVVRGAAEPGSVLKLDPEKVSWLDIGRLPNSALVLRDCTVARRHASIGRDGDAWLLYDGGSTNGTLVNGQPIATSHPLADGDAILIGRTLLSYVDGDALDGAEEEELDAACRARVREAEEMDPWFGLPTDRAFRRMIEATSTRPLCVLALAVHELEVLDPERSELEATWTLPIIARFLSTSLPECATVGMLGRCRLGVSVGLGAAKGRILAESIRAAARDRTFDAPGGYVLERGRLTLSIGVAAVEEGLHARDLVPTALARLDEAVRQSSAMGSSETDSFSVLQSVLAGKAHVPVDDGDFKVLRFMLERPFGQDAVITAERFDIWFGSEDDGNGGRSSYLLKCAPPVVFQLMAWAGLRQVERHTFVILPARSVPARPKWPVAWEFGPRRLWITATPELVQVYVRAHGVDLPPLGPEGPPLPDPIRHKVAWLDLEAPRPCPRCGRASSRFRRSGGWLICQACGRSFERDDFRWSMNAPMPKRARW